MIADWENAVNEGDAEAVRKMLAGGADVDARDRHGQTGLMVAALRGHTDVVRQLVEAGADLDHTAKYRLSALMLAVISGHVEIVRMLVQAGANRELRGSGAPGFHDKTARDLAAARGDARLLAALDSR